MMARERDRIVFVWGENESNQLGSPREIKRTLHPKRMAPKNWENVDDSTSFSTTAINNNNNNKDENHSVLKVFAGMSISCVVLRNGKALLWGKCGHCVDDSYVDSFHTPVSISFSSTTSFGVIIDSVGIGESHLIMSDNKGRCWSLGKGEDGVLGHGSFIKSLSTPKLIVSLQDRFVSLVSAGHRHSACLTDKGEVWTWGSSLEGGSSSIGNTPSPIPESSLPHSITQVASGRTFNCAISSSLGKVWVWGKNMFGVLGYLRDDEEDEADTEKILMYDSDDEDTERVCMQSSFPREIDLPRSSITPIRVSCGLEHVLLLCRHEEKLPSSDHPSTEIIERTKQVQVIRTTILFAWGRGQEGQLGQNNLQDATVPVCVPFREPIENICCGGHRSCLITAGKGLCYTWGQGDRGQLGHEHPTDEWSPKILKGEVFVADHTQDGSTVLSTTSSFSHLKQRIFDVAMGVDHTLLLAENRRISLTLDDIPEDERDGTSADLQGQWEVERILDSRLEYSQRHYLVKWRGYPESRNSWVPASDLKAEELLKEWKESQKQEVQVQEKKEEPHSISSDDSSDMLSGEWEIEKIVDKRIIDGEPQYLVKWKGYPSNQNTWQREQDFSDRSILADFDHEYKLSRSKKAQIKLDLAVLEKGSTPWSFLDEGNEKWGRRFYQRCSNGEETFSVGEFIKTFRGIGSDDFAFALLTDIYETKGEKKIKLEWCVFPQECELDGDFHPKEVFRTHHPCESDIDVILSKVSVVPKADWNEDADSYFYDKMWIPSSGILIDHQLWEKASSSQRREWMRHKKQNRSQKRRKLQ